MSYVEENHPTLDCNAVVTMTSATMLARILERCSSCSRAQAALVRKLGRI